MHLQASSTLIPTTLLTVTKKLRLVKDLPVNATDSCNKGSTDNPCGVDDRPVVDGPAIRFLLSAFVWLDSIASASTCSRPILPLDHQRLLEENEVDMVSVTGCRNWAMAAVVKVCKLDNWKKTLEGENRLSTRKLVDEATAIEQSIRDQAAQMLGNDVFYVSRHPSLSSSQASADYIEKLITTIFALSSLTYLHVVVSGGCPELPEIKESVSKTIEALRQIPEPHLLNRVIWPFCVAGCLAVESQYDFFTDMGDGILSRRHIKAISIIQSCWELRQTQAAPCKWSDVPFSPALLV
jgi:hypothetical protein